MESNEIKKALYKQKPNAAFIQANKEGLLYKTIIHGDISVFFLVPFSDIGDAIFTQNMESQLLIRYLYTK